MLIFTHKTKINFATRLLCSVAVLSLCGGANAQEVDSEQAATKAVIDENVAEVKSAAKQDEVDKSDSEEISDELDEIVITGSRIKRAAIVNISPTTTMKADEFNQRGAINVLDLLEELPALTGSESIDDNQFSFGDVGVRRANLRGMGAYRSLTVVDNRRRAATASSFFGRNSFDWNVLPQNLVKQVDVLTGGASSIYGSDAVSGVINIILKDKMEGFEVGGNAYALEGGGYQNGSAYITGGTSGDRWSLIGSLEYAQNGEYSVYEAGRSGINTWIPNEQPKLGWGHFDKVEKVIDPNAEYDTIPRYNVLDIWNGEYEDVIPSFSGWPFWGYQAIDGKGDVVLDSNGNADVPRWVFGERTPGEGSQWWIDGTANPLIYDRGLGKFRAIDLGSGGLLNFWGCDASQGCEMKSYDRSYWSPTQRLNGYLKGKYDLTNRTKLGVELIYARTGGSSDNGPIFLRRNDNVYAQKWLQQVDLSTPDAGNSDLPTVTGAGLNPLFTGALHGQLNALGQTGFQIATRSLTEFGTRLSTRKQSYVAAAVTLNGEFDNGWTWDVAYDFGHADYTNTTTGQAYGSRFKQSLDIVIDSATGEAVCRSASARAGGCRPADLLNGISPDAANYIKAQNSVFAFTSTQHQFSGNVSGDSSDLFEFPGGPVEFAVGMEWRSENNTRTVDALTAAGTGFFGSQLPSYATSNSVLEGYVETIVPVISDIPGIEMLDFEGAYRVSSYAKGGSGGLLKTYKYGARWVPIKDITVRAVKSRSIRAPHPAELSLPGSIGYIGYVDPCSNASLASNPDRTDNCLAWTGFTRTELSAFAGLNTGQDESGGNPNLLPEVSDTLTVGVVLQPRFLKGFWMTVDYFDIKFNNLIAQLGQQRILNECADRFSPTSQFCQLVDRDSITQEIQLVRDTFVNVNGTVIQGWDMQAGYEFEVDSLFALFSSKGRASKDYGKVNLTFTGQYLEKDDFIDIDGEVTERAGRYWNPDLRLRGSFGYSYKDFRFYWSTNYTGRTETDATEPRWVTKDQFYHDASVTYYLKMGNNNKYARITVGVDNVFNTGTRPHTWTYGGSQFDRISGRGFYMNFSVPLGG